MKSSPQQKPKYRIVIFIQAQNEPKKKKNLSQPHSKQHSAPGVAALNLANPNLPRESILSKINTCWGSVLFPTKFLYSIRKIEKYILSKP